MTYLQPIVHYGLHFAAPLLIAYLYDKSKVWKGYLILLATMLVDLDHLLADPIFDPNRCSIGFHPLHSYYAIAFYLVMLVVVKNKWWRLVFIGLLFHMLTDQIDCWMSGL
ncbi:DUF6122 family protein [Aureibacter tunicatorum]|uniref:Phosphatidylglycerophosphate synthase n=1 Tax=Aureibacter tunicatorum TaxID=866807 RepID=A0AAE3XNL8_9BACT|nr:DUF6122 family protein [Aureibacter tunicatorum]MDR6239190.1 phosphatidylglycerophosphate synthase [Aureibacter tunicatorum]BDD04884.1 hypothetical protein AUTU_23670 [Aureibacter tunicatorum]